MINDIEHPFMGLLAIHIFFLVKCLSNLLLIFKLGYLNSYDGVLSGLVFFLIYSGYQAYNLQMYSTSL